MTTATANAAASLLALFEEVAALHLRLRAVAHDLHRRPELTAACRGVLQDLMREGARTVPQLARRRSCSRQHVQALVNRLRADGLAELVDNPDHRRSRLVRLTPAGRRSRRCGRPRRRWRRASP